MTEFLFQPFFPAFSPSSFSILFEALSAFPITCSLSFSCFDLLCCFIHRPHSHPFWGLNSRLCSTTELYPSAVCHISDSVFPPSLLQVHVIVFDLSGQSRMLSPPSLLNLIRSARSVLPQKVTGSQFPEFRMWAFLESR